MISYGDIKSGEAALPVAKPDANSIPSLIDRASRRLSEAKTSAEVLEAKAAAELALHYAKVTKAANESHADCLRIITRAEIRMAGEIDRGQETGEVAKRGGDRQSKVPSPDNAATMAELGVSRQRVNEWRKVAEAGEEKVEQAISDALAEGRAPTKSDIHRAAGIVKEKPKSDEDSQFEELQRAWNAAGEGARVRFLAANNLQFQAKASEDNGATGSDSEVPTDGMAGEVSRVDAGRTASATSERMDVTAGEAAPEFQSDGDAFVAVKGTARLANVDDVEPSPYDTPSATPAEAAPASPKPPAHAGAVDNSHRWSKLRPYCLNPDCCAGVGKEHCHACKRAMAEGEAA